MTKEEIIQKGEKKFPPDIIEEISDGGKIVRTDVNATIRHAYIQGLIDNNCLLPSNLDEAAKQIVIQKHPCMEDCLILGDRLTRGELIALVKAGAEWMARQGWIDDGSMPPETKHEGNTMQGHREWTESKPVLAWDSMYGPCVDVTKNGKWMSEQRGGYTGQICHGIIAWRPIPEYKEKQ